MTERGARTTEPGLASAQIEEQGRTKEGDGGVRTAGLPSDGGESTNVMRTVG